MVKKFMKNTTENLGYAGDRRDSVWADELSKEQEILESFLPTQLTNDALLAIVAEFIGTNGISGPKGTGLVMKMLKEKYDGLYDGRQASEVVKQALQ